MQPRGLTAGRINTLYRWRAACVPAKIEVALTAWAHDGL